VVRAPLGPRLSRAADTALYFVAAEALTNLTKYAHASAAGFTLRVDHRWVEVTVGHDGIGGATAKTRRWTARTVRPRRGARRPADARQYGRGHDREGARAARHRRRS
jgi:hypothetical protein